LELFLKDFDHNRIVEMQMKIFFSHDLFLKRIERSRLQRLQTAYPKRITGLNNFTL
jgi:hypothetical protein